MIRGIYKALGIYWNARAIARGRYPQRVARRSIYRQTGKIARKLFKP